jgi:hypothetical protein
MSDFDNTNSGTLFVNRDKYTDDTMRTLVEGANPNWPDGKGSINIGGVDHWLSGWRKTAQSSGKKFWSFSVKPKEPKPQPKPVQQQQSEMQEGMAGDDIPW